MRPPEPSTPPPTSQASIEDRLAAVEAQLAELRRRLGELVDDDPDPGIHDPGDPELWADPTPEPDWSTWVDAVAVIPDPDGTVR